MIYTWKPHFPNNGADATAVATHCEKLRKLNGGRLTPRLIVDDAETHTSPTHRCFQWNDRKAADEHRLTQARDMLRSIRVQFDEVSEPVSQYVNVQFEDDAERSYTSIKDAVQNPEQRQQLLDNALREIASWRKKYAGYEELSAIFTAVDEKIAAVG